MLAKIWKKLDYYSKAYPISFALSGVCLGLLFGLGGGHFTMIDPFLEFIPVLFFIATQLSSTTAFAQLMDLTKKQSDKLAAEDEHEHDENAKKRLKFYQLEFWKTSKNKYELAGTLFGILLVLGIGVGLAVKAVATAFWPIINTALLMYSCINIVSNFGMRLGRTIDNDKQNPDRPQIEHTATLSGAAIGMALAAFLVGFKIFTAVSVVGFTSFITGGAAIPVWLGAAAFILQTSSSTSAASYYVARAKTFLKGMWYGENSPELSLKEKEAVQKKFHEYRGSTFGVFAGLSIGGTVTGLLLAGIIASSIFTFGAPAAAFATALVITACVAVIGGICSRIGRFYDKYKQAKEAVLKEERLRLKTDNSDTEPLLSSSPSQSPSPSSTLSTSPTAKVSPASDSDNISPATSPTSPTPRRLSITIPPSPTSPIQVLPSSPRPKPSTPKALEDGLVLGSTFNPTHANPRSPRANSAAVVVASHSSDHGLTSNH